MDTLAEPHRDLIRSCPLFAGVGPAEVGAALDALHARVRRFKRGEIILRAGEAVPSAGLVLEGVVEGSFVSEQFNQVDMERFGAGLLFGEAIACLGGTSPIQLRAAEAGCVLFLDVASLVEQIPSRNGLIGARLLSNLALSLARKDAFLNMKVRILSQRGLRDRILAYLQNLPIGKDGWVTLPLTRTELARYLSVNRSALSRELGRMVDGGIIQMDGKRLRAL